MEGVPKCNVFFLFPVSPVYRGKSKKANQSISIYKWNQNFVLSVVNKTGSSFRGGGAVKSTPQNTDRVNSLK